MFKLSVLPIMSATAHRQTASGGTAILVRHGIIHHSLLIPGLTQLQATAIEFHMDGKPVKVLAAYLSPFRPLIGTDLSTHVGGK
jgi:hypothetical protein